MTTAWVTIRYGSLAQVGVLRAVLEANGIPTNVPEETLGTMDPFMRGRGTVFDYSLQVPAPSVAEAQPLLEAEGPDVEPAFAGELEPAAACHTAGRSESASDARDALDSRWRRARWAALCVWVSPYTLWVAAQTLWRPEYWRRSRGELALDAGAVILALGGCALLVGIAAHEIGWLPL